MSKKTESTMVERAFSQDELRLLENAKNTIFEAQRASEGLAEKIASQLYIIYRKELYIAEGESNMGTYAQKMFGISKGTCSDSINTIERFGVQGVLQDKYREYKFSTLMAMKKFTDEQIERAGINPTMSREQVRAALTAIEEKDNYHKDALNDLFEMASMAKSVLGINASDIKNHLTSVAPALKEVNYAGLTTDEILDCFENLRDMIAEKDPSVFAEPDEDEEEEESSAVEPEENSANLDTLEAAGPVTQDTYPTVLFRREDFYNTVDKSSGFTVVRDRKTKKEIIDMIWPEIELYLKEEQDISFE